MQTAYTVTDNIDKRIEIDKCGFGVLRKGKESECEGITIGSGDVIGEIEGDDYKHLDIMVRSGICQEQMKRSVKTKILSRCQIKLNATVETKCRKKYSKLLISELSQQSDMELE